MIISISLIFIFLYLFGFNTGGHRLPSNKMLLYEHALRMPMVVMGPGVPEGVQLPLLGMH